MLSEDSGFYYYTVLLSVRWRLETLHEDELVDDDEDDANANYCLELFLNPRSLTLRISKTPQMSYLCDDLLTRKDGRGAF